MLITVFLYVVAINFSQVFSEPANVPEYVTCESGWYYWGEKCYKGRGKILQERQSWPHAREMCIRSGGDLVSIESQQEQDFIVTFLQLDLRGRTWIGLSDIGQEGNFRWSDGTVFNYTNWRPGSDPKVSNHKGKNCVHLSFEPENNLIGTWDYRRCNLREQYICEMRTNPIKKSPNPMYCSNERFTGWKWENSCYHVITNAKSWKDAELHCKSYFTGNLVSILDKLEDAFLDYILPNITKELWIGIKIKKQLQQRWTSGWYVSYDGFKNETQFKDGTCVARKKRNDWITIPCGKQLPFVCKVSKEKPLVQKSLPKDSYCPVDSDGWRDLGGKYCYYIEREKAVSFYEALYDCKRRGGNLASVHSKEENDMIVSFFKYHRLNKSFWIGLLRTFPKEEEFAWTDGSAVNYVNWAIDEPYNKGVETCVEIITHDFGYIYKWSDTSCGKKRGYVCSVEKKVPNVDLEDSCKSYCISPTSYLYERLQQSADAKEIKCIADLNYYKCNLMNA